MRSQNRKPKILVIGPLSSTGGMATSMRLQLSSPLGDTYDLVPLDNSKITPVDRSLPQGIWAQLKLARALVGALHAHRPELVHIHTCSGLTFLRSVLDLAISKMCGARVVLHVRGGRFHEYLARVRGLQRWMVRAALVKADRVIVLGDVWAEWLRNFDARIRLAVIRNGADVEPGEPGAVTRRGIRILLVGTTRQSKGVDDLIEAIAVLPAECRQKIEVRIVGPDPEHRTARLGKLIHDRGLEATIALCGEMTPREVREALGETSIFVLPSHAEGMPNALLEAMAHGLPCVASTVGAVPELIRDGVDGLLIEPGDIQALADSLQRLIRDPVLRARLGQSAQKRIRTDFNQAGVCDRLSALYQSLLGSQGAPA